MRPTRAFISPAALLVKVTAKMRCDRHPMLLDEVDDARREHPGLARAGAGEHEHGAVDVLHGLTLCGVQPFEPLHDELAS